MISKVVYNVTWCKPCYLKNPERAQRDFYNAISYISGEWLGMDYVSAPRIYVEFFIDLVESESTYRGTVNVLEYVRSYARGYCNILAGLHKRAERLDRRASWIIYK